MPAASLTKPITGVTIPPPIMVMTIKDEPYLVSCPRFLIPNEKMVGYWIDINALHNVSASRPICPPLKAEIRHRSMASRA